VRDSASPLASEGSVAAVKASSPLSLRTIALAGNPNSGKTTLFNALTGLRQKVANYPGVTVEKKVGRSKLVSPDGTESWANIIDLPGTYSLVSRSPDEVVACEVLRGERPDTPAPDAVIVVVDASNLSRNLYLVSQLVELGCPMLVALSMSDVAQRRGIAVSAHRLEELLGVPVVPIVGHKSTGVPDLKRRLFQARVPRRPDLDLPQELRNETAHLAAELARLHPNSTPSDHPAHHHRTAARLIVGDRAGTLAPLASKDLVKSLLASAAQRLALANVDPIQSDIEARYRWIDALTKESAGQATPVPVTLALHGATHPRPAPSTLSYAPRLHMTDRVDRILIHRVWGLVIFSAVMAALFYSVFSLAQPLMNGTQAAVTWLGNLVTSHIPPGALHDLVNDGIFQGVGTVVVFVPQIAILFGFLAILEDSGYLARAAFLMDRLLAKVGLSGKAFIPLLSSFACAIPGIMATRTIESRKQRLATILIAPFMSCSARLPVYVLLIGTFFDRWGHAAQAGVMFACYLLGVLAAAGTAWALTRFGAHERTHGFVLELPTYKRPQLWEVARQIWLNTSKFVTRAGTVIFCLSVLLWALSYYPRLPEQNAKQIADQYTYARYEELNTKKDSGTLDVSERPQLRELGETLDRVAHGGFYDTEGLNEILVSRGREMVAAQQLRHSISGRLGHFIEPALRPLGFDWKMDIGLISAFAAREVFVSTMGIVYSAGDTEESTDGLKSAMLADKYADGKPVWTLPVACSLLVWFVLAMQCMSTLAVVRRETNGWRWPIAMLVCMNLVAYLGALVTYQVLTRVVS
jgi:ferrous iron transport protein B